MSRFYQTARPTFVDDNIYKPPIELMQDLISTHEARADQLMGETQLLDQATEKIQHLQFDSEKERVKNIQDTYSTKIDEIANTILENPLEYQKHLSKLKDLRSTMVKDKTTGTWASIENRYAGYSKWYEDNKGISKKNATLFNKMNNKIYGDLVNAANQDDHAVFQGRNIIDRPDIIKEYQKTYQDLLKAYDAVESKDGSGYITKTDFITKQRAADLAWNTLMSNPNYAGYVDQMGNFLGEDGYFQDIVDPDGNISRQAINPFAYIGDDGTQFTANQIAGMSPEQRQRISRVINPNHAFSNDLEAVADTYSFERQSSKVDPFALARYKEGLRYKYQKLLNEEEKKEEQLIFRVTEAITTPKEFERDIREWQSLLTQDNADPIRLAILNEKFGSILTNDGDAIIKAAGQDPSQMNNKQKVTAMIDAMTLAQKYEREGREGFKTGELVAERKFDPGLVGYAIKYVPGYNEQNIKTAIQVSRFMNEKSGDFAGYLADNLKVTTPYRVVEVGEKEDNRLLTILDQYGTLTKPNVVQAGLTDTDLAGNKRTAQADIRIDGDTGWLNMDRFFSADDHKTNGNPLEKIKEIVGVQDLNELVRQGYFRAADSPTDAGEITMLWTPTEKFLSVAKPYIKGKGDIGAFKTIYSNVANDLYPDSNDPDAADLHMRWTLGSDRYSSVVQKLDWAEGLRKKDPKLFNETFKDGYMMPLSGYEKTQFGIKDDNNGGFVLTAKNLKTGDTKKMNISRQHILEMGLDGRRAKIGMLTKGVYNSDDIKALEQK